MIPWPNGLGNERGTVVQTMAMIELMPRRRATPRVRSVTSLPRSKRRTTTRSMTAPRIADRAIAMRIASQYGTPIISSTRVGVGRESGEFALREVEHASALEDDAQGEGEHAVDQPG